MTIQFAPQSTRLATPNTILRSISFDDAARSSRTNNLSTSLYVPSLTPLDTELWISDHSVRPEQLSSPDRRIDIFKTTDGHYDYVRFTCYETTKDPSELQELTYEAYKIFFSLIAHGALPKSIIRMWNFVPCLLDHQGDSMRDSERYRQFNSGRLLAWQDHSSLRLDTGSYRVPAATGIGSFDGPLVIEALLSPGQVIDIQNPRQINAYDYSLKYGTHPPVFSRATAQLTPEGAILFISGTASIVQEDTVHEDDPVEQVHETFRNLAALINTENLSNYLPFTPQGIDIADLTGMRVHIKHAEHFSIIEPVVRQYVGTNTVCFVNDDICRDGLLVEIECNGICLKKV